MIAIEMLASEAGFTVYNGCCDGITADLKRFAALVRNEVLEEAATALQHIPCDAKFEQDCVVCNAGDAIRALKDKT